MLQKISLFLDRFSEYYAHRKGLLPMFGIVFILSNFILQLVPPTWFSETNFFLHLGILFAVIGFMVAWAL